MVSGVLVNQTSTKVTLLKCGEQELAPKPAQITIFLFIILIRLEKRHGLGKLKGAFSLEGERTRHTHHGRKPSMMNVTTFALKNELQHALAYATRQRFLIV